MGIKRLSQLLRADLRDTDLSEFRGSRVAVDSLQWVYHAFYSQLDYSGDYTLMVIRMIDLRLKQLQRNQIQVT